MLDKVFSTCNYVVENAKHVRINYDKIEQLIDELLEFDNVHYLTKVPYGIYDMDTRDIINFLLSMDEIYYVENEDYINAIKLMQNYKYTINYSDCLILLSMFNNNIDTIVSFDSDFNRIEGITRIYI